MVTRLNARVKRAVITALILFGGILLCYFLLAFFDTMLDGFLLDWLDRKFVYYEYNSQGLYRAEIRWGRVKEYLYICSGYGEQATGGYSIAVNELYLTDTAIYVSTSLLGPESADKSNKTPSYPYIVIKMEYLDQTVIFE